MLFDPDGRGEREIVASPYTLMIYEQTFKSSLIKDVMGRIDLTGGNTVEVVTPDFVAGRLEAALPDGKRLPKETRALVERAFPATVNKVLDYTTDNWEAYVRALWAMLRTAEEAARASGRPVADPTPPYESWVRSLGPVNMTALSNAVFEETQRGLFHTGTDAD